MAELTAIHLDGARSQIAAIDAAWAAGHAVLPIAPTLPRAQVDALLASLRPKRVVRPGRDGVPDVTVRTDGRAVPDGTAAVVATSGSTGAPKGVVLSHAAIAASTRASLARLGCQRGERWLLCLPLEHVAGLQVLARSRALGAEPVVHDGFDVAAVADAIAAGTVGHISLVPTQLVRLLDAGVDLGPLHGVLLGGAPPGQALLDRATAEGVAVTVSYGMTETVGGCVYDGVPLDGVTVATAEDGRLRIRGDVLMDGYLTHDGIDRTVLDRDGWFTTSDLGTVADDGRVEVSGRADDLVITGGENVAVAPVQAAVAVLPEVREVAVLGRPDPEWGEALVAVVALNPGCTLTLDELRSATAASLPRHARPRRLVVVADLPRTSLGKVDGAALRRMVDVTG